MKTIKITFTNGYSESLSFTNDEGFTFFGDKMTAHRKAIEYAIAMRKVHGNKISSITIK
jgi:hypothetical protein